MQKVSWLAVLLLVIVPATCMAQNSTDNLYCNGPWLGGLQDGDWVYGTSRPEGEVGWGGMKQINLSDLQGPQGEQGIQGIQGVEGEQGIQGEQGLQGPKGDSFDDRTRYYLDLNFCYELKRNLLVGAYTKYNAETSCLDEAGVRVSYQFGRSYLERKVDELQAQINALMRRR